MQMKCVQYWGMEVDVPEEYGHFKVTLTSQDIFADYIVRKVKLEFKVSARVPLANYYENNNQIL